MNIGEKGEPIVEDWWQETVDKLADKKYILRKDFIIEFK